MSVVFDLGGVLCEPVDLFPTLGRVAGVAADRIAERYWDERAPYDRGEPNLGYWSRVLAPSGVRVTAALADELAIVDADLWTEIRPAARAILEDLGARRVQMLIMSNAPCALEPVLLERDWVHLVDGCAISGPLGLAKPDVDFYRYVEGHARAPIFFVDDRAENVDAALARGWRAHLWVDDADTRAWLVSANLL